MGLLRYTASADNTITNGYQLDLKTRGSGANAGVADVLEVYSMYGRINSSSQELSRAIIKFPLDQITNDRTAGNVPKSGSVNFYLRLFNAKHSKTTPIEYKLVVSAVSQSWEEGTGLDLEGYKDKTNGNLGSDWIQAKKGTNWTDYKGQAAPGGTYSTASGETFTQHFSGGLEDLEIDVSDLVEKWIAKTATTVNNYGFGIFLSSSYEASASQQAVDLDSNVLYNPDGATESYYTKRFFARGTQYFFKRPVIEARWDSTTRDDRGNCFFSSSRAPAIDNLNKIYFYNLVRGRLVDLPGIGSTYGTLASQIKVSVFSGSVANSEPSGSAVFLHNTSAKSLVVTGGYVSTGIYSCSLCFTKSTDLETLYDVWFSGSSATSDASAAARQYFTGTMNPKEFTTGVTPLNPTYYCNISNLKNSYQHNETVRLNLYVREKNWNPNIYTRATSQVESLSIRSASYGVVRLLDNEMVIPYGTGSEFHTGLSYNVSGNYFDFDMSLLEKGYAYGFKFVFYDDTINSWIEQDKIFKFWLEER